VRELLAGALPRVPDGADRTSVLKSTAFASSRAKLSNRKPA
jgi:hypothetical protein